MKAWRVHQLLLVRWSGFRALTPKDQQALVELMLSLIAEARREGGCIKCQKGMT